jgi:hypothetical protein
MFSDKKRVFKRAAVKKQLTQKLFFAQFSISILSEIIAERSIFEKKFWGYLAEIQLDTPTSFDVH